jgi:CPA2 family monovalent cation:H+ antiporter-2
LRDAFAVLFFVSVGMLFNPAIVSDQPLLVTMTVLIIVTGNAAAVSSVTLLIQRSRKVAVALGASLAQIGEFSFILAGLGVQLQLLPQMGSDLILAGAIISILINPLMVVSADRLMMWMEPTILHSTDTIQVSDREPSLVPDTPRNHAVIVGYGRVGGRVAKALKQAGYTYLIIEEDKEIVDHLREEGVEAISGNAAQPGLLDAANVVAAKWLISAIPSAFESGALIERARHLNPTIDIAARAHTDAEVDYLKKVGASFIVMGEQEIARTLSNHIIQKDADPAKLPASQVT